uniref:Uncharacterized protein n=1 Tax=Arundo donax TaxID=35708 RepID=A0A0A8ZNR5_ARUDO
MGVQCLFRSSYCQDGARRAQQNLPPAILFLSCV